MSDREHQTISSWDELSKLIEQCHRQGWIFRGESRAPQKDDDRELKPKAGRISRGAGSARKVEYSLKDEQDALKLFQKQARPYLLHEPEFAIEWLAIAQHHGMATRLLDWTESLLVAAYFAAKDAGARGRAGFIFGVLQPPETNEEDEKNPFKIEEIKLYRPPHISPRIPAQRSVFTIHPNPTSTYNPPTLQIWKIDCYVCGHIKAVLDSCAINEASLYPDLDGWSRYIGWRYKWGLRL